MGVGVFAGLVFLIQDAYQAAATPWLATFRTTTGDVGASIFRDYVLPFEAVSFLLLAALIGAIVLVPQGRERVIRLPLRPVLLGRCCSRPACTACWPGGTPCMVLMAIELMLNAVNVNLVAFGRSCTT